MIVKKTAKYILYFMLIMLFLWWFFLSHVTFLKESNTLNEVNSGESDYYAKYYKPKPINLFGIYLTIMEKEPIFVVLYDKEDKYIGQTSPFKMMNMYSFFEGNPTLPEKNPQDILDTHFYIVVVGDFESAYDIDINHKKWWSKVLQYFH
ncbi:DUF6201 family protein [Xenorhabdus bovienii]|uniref:DUF6201 family protein n=1 Tax=Xenorhabdus bovienii TaxID=40576 RepID=A0AAJ1N7R6_XENBV|nr:DUF6201 family protein [Xenorhabdus bovienii]MDE1474867.1 DUF6201 family protein [Xenorhabdus bovienii]MDE1480611.1 DUF6201 family protein [Xenorhabdus bovienii]MDE1488986.1 DUF6201 family protein [Xenorhabdus bovienii]MDE1493077.1 DUF6201 family protein [Xenorhabdus bovienii]MDE1497332.1 DUF6201 family protein [Xenorhabdus bovienii]